jgi:hypothetical protein
MAQNARDAPLSPQQRIEDHQRLRDLRARGTIAQNAHNAPLVSVPQAITGSI